MKWIIHLEGGPRRVNHAGAVVGESIFSFGGYCTGDNYKKRKPMDVHILNTVTYRWTALPVPKRRDPTPFQRYGHTAVVYKDKIYIWGGRDDISACNVLYCFDPGTLTWSKPNVTGDIPEARDGHTACMVGHNMYVFGGYEEGMESLTQEMHKLDMEKMVWYEIHTKGQHPPSYRDFHSASCIGERMYIFGGRGDESGPYHTQREVYCNIIYYFDTVYRTWHKPLININDDVPMGRRSHSAFVYNDVIFIFGGFNAFEDEHYNDMWTFNPECNKWLQVNPTGKGPCARRRQSCCLVGNKLFLFGGTSPDLDEDVSPNRLELSFIDGEDEPGLLDHNDLHVLDFGPTLKTLCILKVIEEKINVSPLPADVRWEMKNMTTNNTITRPLQSTG